MKRLINLGLKSMISSPGELLNKVAQRNTLVVVDDDRNFTRKAGFPKSQYKRPHLLRGIVRPGGENQR